MALDPNLAQKEPADDHHRRLVLDDLGVAAKWMGVEDAKNAELKKENSIMRTWLDLNEDALPLVAGS